MRKKDLIKYVSVESGIIQEDVKAIIDKAFEKIRDEVAAGNKVVIDRFGIFTHRIRPKKRAYDLGGPRRKAKNPKMIILPPKKMPHFKPTKTFNVAA